MWAQIEVKQLELIIWYIDVLLIVIRPHKKKEKIKKSLLKWVGWDVVC